MVAPGLSEVKPMRYGIPNVLVNETSAKKVPGRDSLLERSTSTMDSGDGIPEDLESKTFREVRTTGKGVPVDSSHSSASIEPESVITVNSTSRRLCVDGHLERRDTEQTPSPIISDLMSLLHLLDADLGAFFFFEEGLEEGKLGWVTEPDGKNASEKTSHKQERFDTLTSLLIE